MSPDLLQALQVLTELGVQGGSSQLAELAVLVVPLSVQEPIWDLVGAGRTHNGHDVLQLCR
jgi:hypothetical protein